MKPFACNAPNAVKMQVYHCTPPINCDQFGNWSVHPAFALLCRHRSGFLRKPTRDNLCAQAATALCGPGGMRRTVRCGGQGRAGNQHAVAVIMRSAFLEGVGRHGPVTYSCRSKCSFRPPDVRMPRGFSLPMLNADGVGYRNRVWMPLSMQEVFQIAWNK